MRHLKALQAYLEVATLGSVTAAAKHLGVSQPSVSRMLQDLERDLGQPLFERSGQRLVPTQLGLLLRDDVERALNSVSDVMARAQMLAHNPVRPLRIASVSSAAFGLLPRAWNTLDPQTRGEMIVEIASPDLVRSHVRSGAVDIGIGSLPVEHPDLQICWMGAAPCVLAVRRCDPLAERQGPISLTDLRGRDFVALGNARGLPSRIRRALRTAGITSPALRTTSTMNALAYVREGLGIAVVESISASSSAVADVEFLTLDQTIPYYIGVVTPVATQPCSRGEALIEAMKQIAIQNIPDFTLAASSDHQAIVAELALQEDTP